MAGSPQFAVAYAAVKRVRAIGKYLPRDYEVCLMSEGLGWTFPQQKITPEHEPTKAVLTALQQTTSLTASTAFPLTVHGKPREMEHVIALFFAIPVPSEAHIKNSDSLRFFNLSEVLESNDGNYMEQSTRAMLNSLDQWLRERHVIPFVNPDLVFLCSSEGEGLGGLVRAIIENPLFTSQVQPPEDQLVISLNNPLFSKSSAQDMDTPMTSNA